MLCQSCGKNQANTHIKKFINGNLTEYHLCEQCANKIGYQDVLSSFPFDFNNLLGSFFEEKNSSVLSNKSKSVHCAVCGSSFEDISRTGKIGCANCYKTFFNRLMPSIERIHGNTNHTGKISYLASSDESLIKNKINELKSEMEAAIKDQNFEKAAKLRDEIKELTQKEGFKDE